MSIAVELNVLLWIFGIAATVFGGVSTFLVISNIKASRAHKADVDSNKRHVEQLQRDLKTTIQIRKHQNDDNKAEHKIILRYNMAIGKGLIALGVNGGVKKAVDKLESEVLNLL